MDEKIMELPYELQLALRTIVVLENQKLIFILYYEKRLTLDQIEEKAIGENILRACIDGLWVTGFYEGGFEDDQKFYELTPFGRRLLEGMLNVLWLKEAS